MSAAYLIDMDGVIYREQEMIPGADTFIAQLQQRNIPFLFLTNNSQRSRRDITAKLKTMGIAVEPERIFTSAMATARFLAQQHPHGTAFIIGEGGLITALNQAGYALVDHDPDYVIIGEGRSISMETIDKAVNLVHRGAKLIATNLDPSGPMPGGIRPGCGAVVAMIEKATGHRAFSVGKPSPIMLRMARKQLDMRTADTTMIGDSMTTDILGGVQMGCKTILVLSGITSREKAESYSFSPDQIVDSIADVKLAE